MTLLKDPLRELNVVWLWASELRSPFTNHHIVEEPPPVDGEDDYGIDGHTDDDDSLGSSEGNGSMKGNGNSGNEVSTEDEIDSWFFLL